MSGNTRLYQDLCTALPTLGKAVLSQPVSPLSPVKVMIRPVRMKAGLFYQVESFQDNKAFHRNLTEDELLRHFAAEDDAELLESVLAFLRDLT